MARKETVEAKGQAQKAPPRTALNLPIKYLVISGRDEMKISRSVDGRVEDMSLSGVVFKAPSMKIDDLHLSYDESPVVRNKITMEIDLPGRRKVTAIGEVSWYERSFVAKDQVYHVGVTFREMSPDDRNYLKDYLVAVKKAVKALDLDV